ncbi:MAG: Gfo/Idh/MocA family oxidoreductase [Planctomycetota bacterium]
MAKIKIGIIGTGGMAHGHANNFARIPGVSLHMAMDVVPGRAAAFAEKFDIPWATESLDDVLSDCDAVTIVTPDRFHAEPTLKALRAGLHVMCEKPLTTTLADARKVARAAVKATANGQAHAINFSKRNAPAVIEAIKLVQRGDIGELRHVHGAYLQSWLTANAWGHWTNEAWLWRLSKARGSGGVLADLGCHLLDYTTAATGPIASIRCSLHNYPKVNASGRKVTRAGGVDLDANDTAIIEFTAASGVTGVCHTTRWATGYVNHEQLEVYGTQGAVRFDLGDSSNTLHTCLGKARHKGEWTAREIKHTPTTWQRFVKAIKTGQPAEPDLIRGAELQAYQDACERSADDDATPKKILKWV